jgi:hypothetical protein
LSELSLHAELPSVADQANVMFNAAYKSKIVPGSNKADIQLPGTKALYR